MECYKCGNDNGDWGRLCRDCRLERYEELKLQYQQEEDSVSRRAMLKIIELEDQVNILSLALTRETLAGHQRGQRK